MKKFTSFIILTFLMSMIWITSEAQSNWGYDVNEALITNATDGDEGCQVSSDFKAGENGSDPEGSYANLIDGDPNTFFTSGWSGDAPQPDNHPHYLQIDLKNNPQSKIIWTYTRRNDGWGQSNRPTTIYIMATNDVNDDASWVEVNRLAPGVLPTEAEIMSYTSDMIDMKASYRYLRFYVPTTVGGASIGNYPYFAIGEFQIYPAIEKTDGLSLLTAKLDEIDNIKSKYSYVGTDPGYYPEEKYMEFMSAFEHASFFANESHTDAEYKAEYKKLSDIHKEMDKSMIPVTEGYYYIKSTNSNYATDDPASGKAMFASNNGRLYWGDFNANAGKFAFKFSAMSDTTFSMQNLGNKMYVWMQHDGEDNEDTQIGMTAEPTLGQMFISVGKGQFAIMNTKNSRRYNTQADGTVCAWVGESDSEVSWHLVHITDENLINKLKNDGPKQLIAEGLQKALDNAKQVRRKANDYDKLITDAGQIASNSPASDGNLANLIDGNRGTIFHSLWEGAMATVTTEGIGWHNLQIKLNKEVSKIFFHFDGRDNGEGWHDNPTHITLYGTNDDALGASTAAADSSQWTEIVDMEKAKYGFPGNDNAVSYTSPNIDLGGSFKYLRFVVKHVSTMDGGNRATSFASPDVTGVTFNLSEFQIYDAIPASLSEYYTVPGMKEASDALDALLNAAPEKIANLTATQADIDAVNQAAKAVNDLYVDRDALDAQLKAVIDSAQSVYDIVSGTKRTLISNAGQFSTNSMSWGDTGGNGIANLIDGNINTVFHSIWAKDDMQNASETAEQWNTYLQENFNNGQSIAVGTGYHNLQVALVEPVKSFYFEYTGRNNATWHDNPNDIVIFATNDETAASTADNANQAQWTSITELKSGFPENVGAAHYTSPSIDLGGSYKYIRFVVKNTTNVGAQPERTFNAPDVTGITFNISEFQMYSGVDPERIQYNYVPGMKEAVDAMVPIMNAAKEIKPHEMINSVKIIELRNAVNAVWALYADTTTLSTFFDKYRVYADSSVVGSGIGFVDEQSSIDAFYAAITASRNMVSPTQPNNSQINAAKQNMQNAFATFMTHVAQIKPNVWYSIISGSSYDYAKEQPIFLARTSTGAQLKIGNYPIDGKDPTTDPYATWRFVPIEGKEGQYAIQSLGTGQYFGPYRGRGASLSPLMSHEKSPYRLFYYGNGKFKIQQVGVQDEFDCLKSDRTNLVVLNYPANAGSQQAWKFREVPNDGQMEFSILNNSVQILTFPYELKGESSLSYVNEQVKTYAVKNLIKTESGTKLELTLKNDFEAGEPMVAIINDPEAYDGSLTSVIVGVPANVTDTSSIVANGLVGTLEGLTLTKAGLGYFVSGKLHATTVAELFISGRNGFINPAYVTDAGGNVDKVISTTEILNGIKNIVLPDVATSSKFVNVYSIDGKLLKRNVKATEARNGLAKGIYIIGKKKVAVK